jgi:hypothetical protein
LTCRFHGVVFTQLLNKPVLALSHHARVPALINDPRLTAYCLDIRRCGLTIQTEAFTSLMSSSGEIKRTARRAFYKTATRFHALFPREVTR